MTTEVERFSKKAVSKRMREFHERLGMKGRLYPKPDMQPTELGTLKSADNLSGMHVAAVEREEKELSISQAAARMSVGCRGSCSEMEGHMRTTTRVVLLTLAVLVGTATHGWTQPAVDHGKDSLRGLPGLHVMVDAMGSAAEQTWLQPTWLHRGAFQTEVELQLRLAGIRVLSDAEYWAHRAHPLVSVKVMTYTPSVPPSPCGFAVLVQVQQTARLTSGGSGAPITWQTASVGIGTSGADLSQFIRENSRDLVNELINDWLAVNPKK